MRQVRVVRRRAFREDLIEQYLTIAGEQPAAAEQFRISVERLLRDLSAYPLSGRTWEADDVRLAGVRFRVLTGFSILVFYLIDGDQLIMLRALHGARGDVQRLLAGEIAAGD